MTFLYILIIFVMEDNLKLKIEFTVCKECGYLEKWAGTRQNTFEQKQKVTKVTNSN